MAPTIIVAGATGNSGRSVVEALSKLLTTNSFLSGHRILALTRSSSNPVAQNFAKLPGVEVVEKNWVEITPEWLRQNEVVRAFIAPQADARQFTEESTFHIAALQAGVKYVVRISTTAPNVRPDSVSYYPRSHWAIETLLETPEFERLQWTSLQPNTFSHTYFHSVVDFVKKYRGTGKQGTLGIMGSADAPVAVIDAWDVGVVAAHLLAQEDPSPHNKAKYVLNGPEDITGNQIVKLVEQHIGAKVQNVAFEDTSLVDMWAAHSSEPQNIILSIKASNEPLLKGLCSASTTSHQVLELAAPKTAPAEILESLLKE